MNGYLQYTGQKDEDGIKDSDIDKTGRKHSNWLTMMYPRLHTARKLLSDDGVIFISCDDNEQANLKLLCDDVFGEENFVTNLAWRKTDNQANIGEIARVKEYIIVYTKNINSLSLNKMKLTERAKKEYRYSDNNGQFRRSILLHKTRGRHIYDVETPSGAILSGPWMKKETEFKKLNSEHKIYWTTGGQEQPYGKIYLHESEGQISNDFLGIEYGTNQQGSLEVEALLNGRYFDFPKPSSLIKHFITIGTNNDDIILDFFAGSCTTAHAVMDLNKEDGGNRKYIMVQLPEINKKTEAFKAGYKTIAEVGKARIRQVAEKMKREKPDYKGDLGFKVFKLDKSCIKEWKPNKDDLQQSFIEYENRIKPETTEQELMYEIMLNRGIPLACSIEKRSMGNNSIYNIHKGFMFMCLDEKILRNEVGAISSNIINWIKEIKGYDFQHADNIIVFRDSAFENDETKINMTETLKQSNINSVYSV